LNKNCSIGQKTLEWEPKIWILLPGSAIGHWDTWIRCFFSGSQTHYLCTNDLWIPWCRNTTSNFNSSLKMLGVSVSSKYQSGQSNNCCSSNISWADGFPAPCYLEIFHH
jgi:hypothetical protein